MQSSYKVGDKVRVKHNAGDYAGDYAGTIVEIITLYTDQTVRIKTYRNSNYIFPLKYLEPADTPPSLNTICKHEDRYLNKVGPNLSFWVCRSCKKDLGDE